MAIYHFTVKVMSRSSGRNAIAGAVYRHGQNMMDEKSGQVFTNKTDQDVEHCEISIPENAPMWAKELLLGDVHKNSEKLWNAVEHCEKRSDAQVYREVEFSLPQELTQEQRLALAQEFIQEQFTSRGMIADWSVHNHFDENDHIEKPHVHVMLTMREAIEKNDHIIEKLKSYIGLSSGVYFGPKVVEWNSRALLRNWREKWADCANTHLSKAGLDIRIDHRSYVDQGIELEPQPKLGKSVAEMRKRELHVDRYEEMREVQKRNQELIAKNPHIVLDYITRYQSTFTRQDIAKLLNRYIDDPKEFQSLLSRLEASPQLVILSANEQGEAIKLTTQDVIRLEKQIVSMAAEMAVKPSCPPHLPAIDLSLDKGHKKLKNHGGLSSDQVHAIQHMVADGQLKVVIGYAGAGKTTCLEVAQEIWRSNGYKIVGAAPTGKAASNLEFIGIPSKTLHKWEQEWIHGREQLNSQSVLILDEAGMVDSGRLHFLLEQSGKKGFKVVLIGDPEQLPPIEAGAPTRAIMETVGFAELSTIVRQKIDWQKEATRDLATRQTEKALEDYHQNGNTHYSQDAKEKLIKDWVRYQGQNILTTPSTKDQAPSSLILAHTNQDVQELNELARTAFRKAGLLEEVDYRFTISKPLNLETLDQLSNQSQTFKPKTIKEEIYFAVGDQIVFLRNDYGLHVRNGQLGKIIDIQEELITIQKEDKTTLTIDMGTYNHMDHGYATTIHKSQGSTVDQVFVYASPYMNKHLTYVALTRHKEDVQIYVDTDSIPNKEAWIKALSKNNPQENALDYVLNGSHPMVDLTVEDQKAFILRRSMSGFSDFSLSWQNIKEFTDKVWSQTQDWIFGDLAKNQQEDTLVDKAELADEKIQAIAQKYDLTDYLEPRDKTQKAYIQFAQKDYEALRDYYQFDIEKEKLLEKAVITGIVQHLSTTMDRLDNKLTQERLQETYDRAATVASFYQQHFEYHNKALGINKALDLANAHIAQDQETIHKIVKDCLPDHHEQQKLRTLFKEKSRLQIQFAKKLTPKQSTKLASEVDHHHEQKNPTESHHLVSLRQHMFGESHNLNTLKHEIMQHHIQQKQAQHVHENHKNHHLSLTP